MRRGEGDVAEEGPFPCPVGDEGGGGVGDEVGGVPLGRRWLVVDVPVDLPFALAGPVVGGAVIAADVLGEALGERMPLRFEVPQVPFAEGAAMGVAGLAERFGER